MSKQLRTARHRLLIATLVKARHEAGLTQQELAARLVRVQSFVAKVETGERQLSILEFCDYAEALGWDRAELLRSAVKDRR